MTDLMTYPPRDPGTEPLQLVVLSNDEMALLRKLLAPDGFRIDTVFTTEAALRDNGYTIDEARDAYAKCKLPFEGDVDYCQIIDIALDSDHLLFDLLEDERLGHSPI